MNPFVLIFSSENKFKLLTRGPKVENIDFFVRGSSIFT